MRYLALLVAAVLASPAAAGPVPLTPDQSALRGRLDHAFMDAGVRVNVEAISDPKGFAMVAGGKMPVLLIWNNYLTRPDVYQIQSKLDVIGEARKASFAAVIFYSATGTGSLYRFDVSKPVSAGQTCARDLCF